jgi:hypothetical protein
MLKTRKTQPCPSALIFFFNVPLDASAEMRAEKGDGQRAKTAAASRSA